MPKHPRHESARKYDCFETEALLEQYLDSELAADRQAALETHLAGCGACAAELDLARRIRTELHELPAMSCPPEVTRAVFGHADAHPPLGERLRGLWSVHRLWQPVFATLVAVALGIGIWRLSDPVAPTPPGGAEAAYTEAEIAQAETELKLALAYLSEIGEKARDQFSAEVGGRVVAPFTRSIAGALLPADDASPAPDEEDGGGARP